MLGGAAAAHGDRGLLKSFLDPEGVDHSEATCLWDRVRCGDGCEGRAWRMALD
jgi:hypothetical protein